MARISGVDKLLSLLVLLLGAAFVLSMLISLSDTKDQVSELWLLGTGVTSALGLYLMHQRDPKSAWVCLLYASVALSLGSVYAFFAYPQPKDIVLPVGVVSVAFLLLSSFWLVRLRRRRSEAQEVSDEHEE